MKVIVDTSVWSLVLRKKKKKIESDEVKIIKTFQELLEDSRIQLIGPIRQELLSGISEKITFIKLKNHLEAFEDIEITSNVYETAANFYNICMKKGIQGSHIDFLICAIAYNNDLGIFTLDKDFINYSKYIKINLFK